MILAKYPARLLIPAALTGLVLLAGCSSNSDSGSSAMMATTPKADAMAPACNLRAQLIGLLREHVSLAAATTAAAVANRPEELNAAHSALDMNSKALAAAFASAYDTRTSTDFWNRWKAHTDALVRYAQAIQQQNSDAKTKAQADLLGSQADLASFLDRTTGSRLNTNSLLHEHVVGLMMIADDQAKNDQMGAYKAVHDCEVSMDNFATALAGAVADQYPAKLK